MKYVLFVCNHNAGRSQMAQALFERDAPEDIRAESAGSTPATAIWPEVIEAMDEIGIDLRGRRPTRLLPETQLHADWAITMGCADACPYVPTTVEDWDIPDPAARPLSDVRAIREGIEAHVRDLIEHRIDRIRSDTTAHELRLAHLLTELAPEFEAVHTAEEIRACADAILAHYADVPVRSFVSILALRQARTCLRKPTCDALAPA